MSANPLHATFFAFHKRERGGALLSSSITFIVLTILLFVGWIALMAAVFGFSSFGPKSALDPSAAVGMVGTVILMEFVLLFFMFVLLAAYEAACLRWMIRGERGGLFGLTLGADTWRVYGGYWMWLMFFVVGYVLLIILAATLFAAEYFFRDMPPAVGVGWGIFAAIVCATLPIYLAVRTAPAAATSVGLKRFAFFDSWKVSKGRFWALFGSYFLIWLIYLIVLSVQWSILFGGMFAAMFDAMRNSPGNPSATSAAMEGAMSQVMSTPSGQVLYWSVTAIGWILGPLFAVLGYGVNARAVIAAAEDGRIEGVIANTLAKTFE